MKDLITTSNVTFNNINVDGNLVIDNGSFTTTITTGATSSYSLVFPIDDGTANQVLKTNGSGTLSWTDQTGTNTFTKVGTVGYNQNAVNFNPTVEMLNGGGPVATLPDNRLDGNTAITAEEAFAVFKANSNNNATILGSSVASIGSSQFGISFFSSFVLLL